MKTDKYKQFSNVFSKLSDESQDKLVQIAHRLLKNHKFAKRENSEKKSTIKQVSV